MDRLFNVDFYIKVKNGSLLKNCQIVLRAHPIGGLLRFKKILDQYKDIIPMETNSEDPKFLLKWIPSLEDIKCLVNIIYYSNVIINHCSTFTLDAFVFDKPVINLAYDLLRKSKMEEYVINCYKYDHYACVLDYNSVKIAFSEEELINHINHYLQYPSSEEEGRKRVLELQLGKIRGNSSEIISNKLLELI